MRSFPATRPVRLLLLPLLLFAAAGAGAQERTAREVLAELIVAPEDSETALVEELSGYGDPVIRELYEAWRTGDVHAQPGAGPAGVLLNHPDGGWSRVLDGEALTLDAAAVEALEKQRPNRSLRRELKSLIDTLGLTAPDPANRAGSARKLGLSQDPVFLEALVARSAIETDASVRAALAEGIAISRLKNGSETEVAEAVAHLGGIKSIPGRDFVEDVLNAEIEAGRENGALAQSARALPQRENRTVIATP